VRNVLAAATWRRALKKQEFQEATKTWQSWAPLHCLAEPFEESLVSGVTLHDIAMLVGVSHQAVSATLRGSGSSRVSAATREKILKLARQLNYVPNPAALSLAGVETRSIGIVTGTLTGLQSVIADDICNLLLTRGYSPLLLPPVSTEGNVSASSLSAAVQGLVARGVDGVIILLNEPPPRNTGEQRVPYVHCANDWPDSDLGIDKEQTGTLPTRHLLEHGHQRIGFVQITRSNSERSLGWQKAMQEQGIDPEPTWRICLRELDGRGELFLERLRYTKLTALFAQNDYVACKVMSLLLQHGIQVPEDIAIVGCDGYAFTDFMPGGLTTVVQPISTLATQAVDIMLERISNRDLEAQPAKIRIPPILRRAGSCGCAPLRIEKLYRINTLSLLEKDYLLNFNDDILEQ